MTVLILVPEPAILSFKASVADNPCVCAQIYKRTGQQVIVNPLGDMMVRFCCNNVWSYQDQLGATPCKAAWLPRQLNAPAQHQA